MSASNGMQSRAHNWRVAGAVALTVLVIAWLALAIGMVQLLGALGSGNTVGTAILTGLALMFASFPAIIVWHKGLEGLGMAALAFLASVVLFFGTCVVAGRVVFQ